MNFLLLGLSALLVIAGSFPLAAQTIQKDPYIWLEKLDSPQSMQWVKTENTKTLSVLERSSQFAGLYKDALAIAQAQDRIPIPAMLDGKVFNFWQDSDHVRGIWRYTTPEQYQRGHPTWITVLDLDDLSKKENANWVWKGANCEDVKQQQCLISLSDGGEDAVVIREFNIRDAKFVDQGFFIPKGKSRAAWQDSDTLLVSREWKAGELTKSGYPFIVKRLARGSALTSAKEIFRGKSIDGGYGVSPEALADAQGNHALIISRPLSTFEFEKFIVIGSAVKKLAVPLKSEFVALINGQLVMKLAQAWKPEEVSFPQGALVAVDLKSVAQRPERLTPTLIVAPAERQALGSVASSRDALIVERLDNVRGRLTLYAPQTNGTWAGAEVAVPDNSAVSIESSDWHGSEAYVSISGYLQPPSLWLLNTSDQRFLKIRENAPKFDASSAEVRQYEAISSDGVKVPYFVVGPKNLKPNGINPTILYAYGGFDVSLTPSYIANAGKLWIEKGGVFVVANIRGGGEFGPAWHDAGLKTKRQIIYDDFAAVARDLVTRNITDAKHLGIQGGSNGGLLMGVQMTQHPELWSAVDIQVPLLDMLRFEYIAAGPSWVGEYGSVTKKDEKKFLALISPYNNIKKGVRYPEAFVWTTTKDDRVGPQHARKFAARLSEFGIPYLFYEVTEGGHGAGANLRESAHTTALEYTYFARQLMRE